MSLTLALAARRAKPGSPARLPAAAGRAVRKQTGAADRRATHADRDDDLRTSRAAQHAGAG